MNHAHFLEIAIKEALLGIQSEHGGPFGAVVVKDNQVISSSHNHVLIHNDPTAHAEVMAIRLACEKLGDFSLDGCVLYASCQPCPMCLSAIHWARIDAYYYAATSADAASVDFDDALLYAEFEKAPDQRLTLGQHLAVEGFRQPFLQWQAKEDRKMY